MCTLCQRVWQNGDNLDAISKRSCNIKWGGEWYHAIKENILEKLALASQTDVISKKHHLRAELVRTVNIASEIVAARNRLEDLKAITSDIEQLIWI